MWAKSSHRRGELPLVLHVVHSLEGGGTERVLVELLRAFDATLVRHCVAALRAPGSGVSRLPENIACVALEARGRSRLNGLRLGRIARTLRPAIVHARNTGCWNDAIIAKILAPGARLVLGFHGVESASRLTRRQRRSARWGMRCGAQFTSVSEAGRQQLHVDAGVPVSKTEVLANGVDLTRFAAVGGLARRQVRESLSLPDAAFVVGTVGSLTSVKRQALLVEAVARLSATNANLRLLIVGDGPLRSALEKQAFEAGIADRVRFTGLRDDVPALLSTMEVFVCSSASEGMSNALLEAMAGGLPIVATDVGDNALMIRDHREGLIVQPESAAAIAQAIRTMTELPALRQALAAAAQVRAQAYDFGQVVQRYERYYSALVAPTASRRRSWARWIGGGDTPRAQYA